MAEDAQHAEPEDMGADEQIPAELIELHEVLEWEAAMGERGVLGA